MKFTPEDQLKLRDKELANIIRKLNAGKTLTSREQAKLDAATAAPGIDPSGYVGTWDELAGRLGVSRKTIQNWRDDSRYAPEIERRRHLLERADGRHCVAEWLRLMTDLRLNRGKAPAEAGIDPETGDESEEGLIQPPRYGGREMDWTKAKIAKEVEKRSIELDTMQRKLLVAADLEVPLGAMLAAIQTKLSSFPSRNARHLVGRRDVGEVEDLLHDEIDADLGDLQRGDYLAENAVRLAVAAVPFDAATEDLCGRLLFDGADRSALLALAGSIAEQALRSIGQAVIKRSLHDQGLPDTSLADETTGQVKDEAAAREAERRSAPSHSKLPIGDSLRAKIRQDVPVTSAASAKADQPAAKKSSGRRRKARPEPTSAPPEMEAAIYRNPKKKRR